MVSGKYKVTRTDIDNAFEAVERLVEAVKYDLVEECYTPSTYLGLIEAIKELEIKWDSYLSQYLESI